MLPSSFTDRHTTSPALAPRPPPRSTTTIAHALTTANIAIPRLAACSHSTSRATASATTGKAGRAPAASCPVGIPMRWSALFESGPGVGCHAGIPGLLHPPGALLASQAVPPRDAPRFVRGRLSFVGHVVALIAIWAARAMAHIPPHINAANQRCNHAPQSIRRGAIMKTPNTASKKPT